MPVLQGAILKPLEVLIVASRFSLLDADYSQEFLQKQSLDLPKTLDPKHLRRPSGSLDFRDSFSEKSVAKKFDDRILSNLRIRFGYPLAVERFKQNRQTKKKVETRTDCVSWSVRPHRAADQKIASRSAIS